MMKKKGLLLLAIFCISMYCCSCGNNQSKTNTPTKKEQYQAAQKLYDAQKYQEAYNGFKALGQYSDSLSKASQSYALMISDAMQGGDYEKALPLLKASDIDQLQIDDKDTLILQCQYGQILDKMNQNDFEGARALIASLTDQNVAAEVTTECDYKQGSYLYTQKKYQHAAQYFTKTLNYEQTSDYLLKIAKKLVKQKKYDAALSICKQLGNTKAVKKVVANIYIKQKYARFKKGVEKGEYLLTEDLRYLTASETEQILKKYFYGTWVEYTTQKKLTISKYERGGKRYGIYTATTDGCFTTIYYYYMDNPKKIYIDWHHEMNVPGYVSHYAIDARRQDGYAYEEYSYMPKSLQDIRENDRLPGYEEDQYTDTTNDDTSSSSNGNNSSNSDSSSQNDFDENEVVAIAEAGLGEAILKTSYAKYSTGWTNQGVVSVKKNSFGQPQVKFKVFFPQKNSVKYVDVILMKSPMQGYRVFRGVIY